MLPVKLRRARDPSLRGKRTPNDGAGRRTRSLPAGTPFASTLPRPGSNGKATKKRRAENGIKWFEQSTLQLDLKKKLTLRYCSRLLMVTGISLPPLRSSTAEPGRVKSSPRSVMGQPSSVKACRAACLCTGVSDESWSMRRFSSTKRDRDLYVRAKTGSSCTKSEPVK